LGPVVAQAARRAVEATRSKRVIESILQAVR
jgi:hypothetical protein